MRFLEGADLCARQQLDKTKKRGNGNAVRALGFAGCADPLVTGQITRMLDRSLEKLTEERQGRVIFVGGILAPCRNHHELIKRNHRGALYDLRKEKQKER